MRYVPRNCIKPSAELAHPILGINGEILLQKGVKMKKSYIRRMEKLGIPGAYIHDALSEGVEVVNSLSSELRARTVREISRCYSQAETGQKAKRDDSAGLFRMAGEIVDELTAQSDMMLNLFDVKVYDSYTFYHCVNVTVLSVVIGLGLGYARQRLVKLAFAALLHDVGKVFISPAIINKPDALTPEEFEEIKQHPRLGYDYLNKWYASGKSAALSPAVLMGIRDHHERMDASGYPSAKPGEKITEFGRIIAVADVYDALISDRPYRKGLFTADAMEYILSGAGSLFDLRIVGIFSRKVAIFPVGTCVMLSNGSIGLVLENFEGLTQRPLLRIIEEGGVNVKPYSLDLSQDALNLTIISTVEM